MTSLVIDRPTIPVCPRKDAMWTRTDGVSAYYDRDGTRISLWDYVQLVDKSDREYKRVARTTIVEAADPSKSLEISTVWLGLDHSMFSDGPPLIFETMVFGQGSSLDLDCERYATEDAARRGHDEMLLLVRATMTDPIIVDMYEVRVR